MSAKARRTFRLIGSATVGWNQSATLTDAAGTTTAAIASARPGDAVIVTPLALTTGIVYSGTVTAPGVVTIRGQNVTAGTIDPAPTTLTVIVLRP